MPYTPLIKKLNAESTTFYTFESASNDLSKCLGNTSTKEFVFSHFVCLDLPDILNVKRQPASDPNADGQVLDNPLGLNSTPTTVAQSSSECVAEYLQDYILNFEEHLLSHANQSVTGNEDKSPAERVFWHWLNKLGAIKWKAAQNDNDPTNHEAAYGLNRYVENDNDPTYKKVVKYIGDIDVTNNVDLNNEAYTEIYIHIPAESGNTPTVLFENVENKYYEKNKTYSAQHYIYGQTTDTSDEGISNITLCDSINNSNENYVTGGLDTDCMCVDFKATSYQDIMRIASINTIQDYNNSSYSETFEFNTVLLYYDVVDVSNGERTSNLYGILFLGDVQSSDQENIPDYFQRYPKYKPSENVHNGNSYGFKVNLRIDLEPTKNGIHTLVNEYNTFSMSLFADAVAKIQNCANTFLSLKTEFAKTSDRLDLVEALMANVANYNQLKESIQTLQEELENANLAFADRNTLVDLIAKINDDVKKLAKGGLTKNLQMNLDVVKPGYMVDVDTSNPQNIVIGSKNAGYSICKLNLVDTGEEVSQLNPMNLASNGIQGRTGNDVYTHLLGSSNMLRFYTDGVNLADTDIVIYINDSLYTWRTGQNFKISFPNLTLDTLNGHNIVILTDYSNKNGNGSYAVKDVVTFGELKNDKPVVEIICVDDTFSSATPIVHDIIR